MTRLWADPGDDPARQDSVLSVSGFAPRGNDEWWWPGCRRPASPEVERAWAEKMTCLKHGDPRRAYAEKILYGYPIHPATEEGCRNFPALVTDWEASVARVYQVPLGLLTDRDRFAAPSRIIQATGERDAERLYGRNSLLAGVTHDLISVDEAQNLGRGIWESLIEKKIDVGAWERAPDGGQQWRNGDGTLREFQRHGGIFGYDEAPPQPIGQTHNIVIKKDMMTFDVAFDTGPGLLERGAAFMKSLREHTHGRPPVERIYTDQSEPATPEPPVKLTVETLRELERQFNETYFRRPSRIAKDATYEGRRIQIVNHLHKSLQETIDMKFSTFTLKADKASLGERQLLDVPQDMCVRFASLEDGPASEGRPLVIEVTYSQPTKSKSKPRATAFVVLDAKAPTLDAVKFEDTNAPSGPPGPGCRDDGDEPKTAQVHRVASAGGFLVFEAL